jgi:transcriptional regulator with XRE-family HTH domain
MKTRVPTLGAEIQRLRMKAGLTLRRFAQHVRASAAHISDIERDKRRPSKELLERIAEQLHSVGASYENLDRLNSRLEPELQRWVSETPAARQLLRRVFDSRRDPRDVLREMEEQLRKKDGGK